MKKTKKTVPLRESWSQGQKSCSGEAGGSRIPLGPKECMGQGWRSWDGGLRRWVLNTVNGHTSPLSSQPVSLSPHAVP